MASTDSRSAGHLGDAARERTSGTPVLCLHCSTGTSRQWGSLAATLGGAHHVVAPDLLGYGENPPWPSNRPLSLDDEIARLMPLIEGAGRPVDVVGHSFGAAVAVKLALMHPHRVRSLCVYEPVLFGLLREDAASTPALSQILMTSALIRGSLNLGDTEGAAARFIDFWSGECAWNGMPAARREGVRVRIEKVRADFDALFAEDISLTALARLDIPVLCLSGKRSPAAARRVAELLDVALPDVRSRRFTNAGHMGPLTHAREVNASIKEFLKFLSRRKARGARHLVQTLFAARAA